jgi:hypothetical protein
MRLFRILFALDVLGYLALVYFFVDGLRYPSSGGNYFGTWMPILLVPIAILAGAWALQSKGHGVPAKVLLAILAAPFVLYLLFVGMMVVLQPSFR